ncbi:hypothetical protein OP10G_0144 [Fimbriimonas ginsengisoli Gsoil 348]|uniref:Peptidase S24/S26A/S26B/S26C domain-containing protein n=1 Tax=Fimbriimonas ginsengisoli Gsoil 348 TaxID=661478 RepID=A0A068NJ78_FIMGI|nr:hypothetical protein OP10G_0144 [Fimbriimonas ginsengisoli Gsoil 348]
MIFEDRMPMPGQAVLAIKDGEQTFKILKGDVGRYELWPLNEDYDPFSASGFDIIGTLVLRIRYLDGGLRDTREYPTHWKFRSLKRR